CAPSGAGCLEGGPATPRRGGRRGPTGGGNNCSPRTLSPCISPLPGDRHARRHDPRHATGGPAMNGVSSKVTQRHLQRNAYRYLRQPTLRQVLENTESTQRQYALRERAVAPGWPIERVITIDSDLGQSGASAADREGFHRLAAEVRLGRAGIVLGLEVSRLARNCSDWHR